MNQKCDIACCKLTFSEEEKNHYNQLRDKIFNKLVRTEELADGSSANKKVDHPESPFLYD